MLTSRDTHEVPVDVRHQLRTHLESVRAAAVAVYIETIRAHNARTREDLGPAATAPTSPVRQHLLRPGSPSVTGALLPIARPVRRGVSAGRGGRP
jgi:hypothetical protein